MKTATKNMHIAVASTNPTISKSIISASITPAGPMTVVQHFKHYRNKAKDKLVMLLVLGLLLLLSILLRMKVLEEVPVIN